MLKNSFTHAGRFWGCDETFRLIIRKGVYSYKYLDGSKKLEETSIPPKDAFYSSLNMKGISGQDDEHA